MTVSHSWMWTPRQGSDRACRLSSRGSSIAWHIAPTANRADRKTRTGVTAQLWDAEKAGAPPAPDRRPLLIGGSFYSVAYSPDGHTVLTGSTDQTAQLWDAATGKPDRYPLCRTKKPVYHAVLQPPMARRVLDR